MNKFEGVFSFIPFINQYDPWVRVLILFLIFLLVVVLVTTYPKHQLSSDVTSEQGTKTSNFTKIGEVKGDYVVRDKIIVNSYGDKEGVVRKPNSLKISEIREAINKAAPLQKDIIKGSFKNILIEWDLALFRAEIEDKGIVRLVFTTRDLTNYLVLCRVPVADYPELNILHEGARIKVRGRIEKVDSLSIDLKDVMLFFPS